MCMYALMISLWPELCLSILESEQGEKHEVGVVGEVRTGDCFLASEKVG